MNFYTIFFQRHKYVLPQILVLHIQVQLVLSESASFVEFSNKEIENKSVKIIGKVIENRQKY